MVQIKNPVTIVQSGGGGVTRPTTWAGFAAMSTSDMQQVYGAGDRVGIACPWTSTANGQRYTDIGWQIAGWGTTKKENDNTEYPCVTLMALAGTTGTYAFDAPETPVLATEETAQDGIYYFGHMGTSTTYTSLSLNVGDTIPYSDYTHIYKTSVTGDATYYGQIVEYGDNLYKDSAIRQWLNSDAAANSWWQSTHVGDAEPAYSNQAGFMSGLESDFKNILQRTEVQTAGNSAIYGGTIYSTYDYLFLPSVYEVYVADNPVEGERMGCFAVSSRGKGGLRCRSQLSSGSNGQSSTWRLRTAQANVAQNGYYIKTDGSGYTAGVSTAQQIVPACKIILPA